MDERIRAQGFEVAGFATTVMVMGLVVSIATRFVKYAFGSSQTRPQLSTGETVPDWVPSAWDKLNSYAVSEGIMFFSLNEAYRSMVEHRMPVDDITGRPLHPAIEAELSIYKTCLETGPLPNWEIPSRQSIENLRTYLAGYHMMAVGEATDRIVDDVYGLIRDRFLEFASAYEGGPGQKLDPEVFGYILMWYRDVAAAAALFTDGSRADKVIAIDAVAHLLHECEPRPLAEDLFVVGIHESFEVTPLWIAFGQLFDIWFGIDPRRGISLADYILGRGEILP